MKMMDLLFKRYADPFSLLNGYIQTARFTEFIEVLCEQKQEDDRWEFYLHRVWHQTYTDYCESLDNFQGEQAMSEDDLEATVKKSMNILGNFNPANEEGEM